MAFRHYLWIAAMAAGIGAAPANAQNSSDAERLITAVKERDVGTAVGVLRAKPGMVNVRNAAGETALTIVIARRDEEWTSFLLSQGADPNAPARNGETALIMAARIGYSTGAARLLAGKAKVDATNRMGETALIVAVQQRHLPIVRMLLAAGADPDKADSAAGYSARDYAKRDVRGREILRLIESSKPKP